MAAEFNYGQTIEIPGEGQVEITWTNGFAATYTRQDGTFGDTNLDEISPAR